jgi:hypothetical protein
MTWTIEGSIEGGDLDVFAVDKTLGNYRVCMVDCDNDSVSNHDHMANARLIAAAPDLLAALEHVDDYLAPQGDEEDAYNYIRAIIKGAISKAQGA